MPAESANPDSDAARIDREASEWFVELQSGSISPAQRRSFERWLAADQRHAVAFEETRACWSELAGMTHWAAAASTGDLARTPWLRRILDPLAAWLERMKLRIAVPAVTVAVLAAIVIVRVTTGERATVESYATRVAEIREIALKDGSVVTLGARSTMDVEFTGRERRIMLKSGEAYFEVEKDSARAFLVHAGATLVRAVGTKFDVHSDSRQVRVAVLEGVVEVSPAADTSAHQVPMARALRAGQEVIASSAGALDEIRSSAGFGSAWRTGRLVYEDAALNDILWDVSRYYDGEIVLADPSLGQLRVTASFRADDVEQLISTLVLGFPVEAARPTARRIVLARRSALP